MNTKLLWRLAAVVLVLTLGGGASYALVGGDHDDNKDTKPSTQPTEPAPAPVPSDDVGPDNDEGWREAARDYAVAYTNTTGGHAAWLRRLRPLISPSLAAGYKWTDVRNVPRARFAALSGGEDTAGETPTRNVELRYAGGLVVDVRVSQDPASGRWVVTTAVPATPDQTEEGAPA